MSEYAICTRIIVSHYSRISCLLMSCDNLESYYI